MRKRICSICVRGGSKGVPNKNSKFLLNKPLIVYSIEQARKSGLFEYIVVSSDDLSLLQIATSFGVDGTVLRPLELANDKSPKIPAIQHCIQTIEERLAIQFDTIVDLDVTSPLREVEDIVNAVDLLETRNVSNVLTGYPSRRSPYFNLVERNKAGFVSLSKPNTEIYRRQDSPECFDLNSSIYVWQHDKLFESISIIHPDTLIYEMPYERSIDIDCPLDFEIVELLMSKKNLKRLNQNELQN
jgi:CMP-N,N'-diacetyllegionaminic acid synthase